MENLLDRLDLLSITMILSFLLGVAFVVIEWFQRRETNIFGAVTVVTSGFMLLPATELIAMGLYGGQAIGGLSFESLPPDCVIPDSWRGYLAGAGMLAFYFSLVFISKAFKKAFSKQRD